MMRFSRKYMQRRNKSIWSFYKKLLWLAVPIMVQNAITNFVGLLDNIMVGKLGTEQMSGVAIVNQLVLVYSLCVFGGMSGAGIFGAQFYGKRDYKGLRDTFRYKLLLGAGIAVFTLLVLGLGGQQLINMYLTSSDTGNVELTYQYGQLYLKMILLEILPFTVVQVYASTLRETGETVVPMAAGVAAVVVNLFLNYTLIYGHFGAPEMGVEGAALATVISRVVECVIVVAWSHAHIKKNPFMIGVYRSLRIPASLAKRITIKGTPLLLNEFFWAAGVAMVNQCFSVRGLPVVAAINITGTINNLFSVVFISMGSCVSILVGQHLGAGEFEEAKSTAGKVMLFTVLLTVVTALGMVAASGPFPDIYNTTEEVRGLARSMMRILAAFMPAQAFLNVVYFTIRSGGRTGITFLFDSAYSWCVGLPFAWCLVHFTPWDILVVYTLYNCLDIIKTAVGFVLYRKGIWIRNIVEEM